MGSAALQKDFPFTDVDFQDIAAFAHKLFGLHLEPCKKQLVYSRLTKRLRSLGLESFCDYRDVLHGPKGQGECREMLSALTTNVTQFFREQHHFDLLRTQVLPDLLQTAKAGGRVRFWSAGCSAGQEAYSLALTILDLCPDADRHDIRILATDVDPVIVARAIQGRYPVSEHAAIPMASRNTHTKSANDTTFSMSPAVRGLVSFGELNLMNAWPMKGSFDVILCRNVAIYFDAATQARLWKRFVDQMKPGGYLMIGHSERLSGPATETLQSSGVTTYRKISSGVSATGQKKDPLK